MPLSVLFAHPDPRGTRRKTGAVTEIDPRSGPVLAAAETLQLLLRGDGDLRPGRGSTPGSGSASPAAGSYGSE